MASFAKMLRRVFFLSVSALVFYLLTVGFSSKRVESASEAESSLYKDDGCMNFEHYAGVAHGPYSSGPLKLPFQRPPRDCRTFESPKIEQVINQFKAQLADPDLARLFENCFPNTLDTTVRWHGGDTGRPQSFIVTGDINAEWIRDSHHQLSVYQRYVKEDRAIHQLILGAINTHVEFMSQSPYCNAFNAPRDSGISPVVNDEEVEQTDYVVPSYDRRVVFECKYELDSVASFFGLANDFYEASGELVFADSKWQATAHKLYLQILDQMAPTYDENGAVIEPFYRFSRLTRLGSETLVLEGSGHPVNGGTGLVRSAFRPSDDATIFQLFIPANAQVSVELQRTAKIFDALKDPQWANKFRSLGQGIEQAVWENGTYTHKQFGKVFAYEVDGFGGQSNLDDANFPSLLSMPDFGFLSIDDPVYQNTRKMILSKQGNPYYLKGRFFEGIGGPHIGIRNAWPLSHLVRIRTSDDDEEIKRELEIVKKSTSGLGLMHESVKVDSLSGRWVYTRPWFAWANSEFGKTILDVATRKPHLLFGDQKAAAYVSESHETL